MSALIATALFSLVLLTCAPGGAWAQAPEAAPPAQVRELLKLLGEPKVRSWLEDELKRVPAKDQTRPASLSRLTAERIALSRTRVDQLRAAASRLPDEFRNAAAVLSGELQSRSFLEVLALIFGFALLGLGAEWGFWRGTHAARLRAEHAPLDTVGHPLRATAVRFGFGLAAVAVFAAGSIGAFLALDWPPVLKAVVLAYLLAALASRVALLVSRLLLEPRVRPEDAARYRLVPMAEEAAAFWHLRISVFAAWLFFGWATCEALDALGFSDDAQSLVAFTLGLGLLLIAIESLWRRPRPAAASTSQTRHRRREALDWLLTVYLVLIWLMWVLGLWGFFSLAIVALLLPVAFSAMNRAALRPDEHAIPGRSASLATVYVGRGLRAVLILAAALFLARFWEIDVVQLTGQDTLLTRLVRGALSAVVIFLAADLLWQIMKTLIDRRLAAATGAASLEGEATAREARLRTLLPIFRMLAFVVLAVLAVMMALSALGVEIGPLIASAGIVGVAVGFGSQTLVRDVISGIFYLSDDAFRVGEYIQSGSYKGTVESFSLRSVKLRHHRGPVYTVPFGQLGAVQNMSRDWVIDKMTIGVTYDSNIDKAKKLIKDIGKELAADPEFAPHVIEPLKMQGVEQFGDYAIQLRLKMMTKPNEQFVMRRRALSMIKKAFDENGIRFAFPTVHVGGGDTAKAAATVPVLITGKLPPGAS